MTTLESEIAQAISFVMDDGSGWVANARVADCELWMPGFWGSDDVLNAGLEGVTSVYLPSPQELEAIREDRRRAGVTAQPLDKDMRARLSTIGRGAGRVDVSVVGHFGEIGSALRFESYGRDFRIRVWCADGAYRQSAVSWVQDRWVGKDKASPALAGVASIVHRGRADFWRVVVQPDGRAPISFCTDPVGVSESFKIREAPSPTKRRTALLHWVAEHWRKKRDEPSAVVAVREHLRGATSFVWNDWTCKIRPSRVDIAKLGDLGKKFVRDEQ